MARSRRRRSSRRWRRWQPLVITASMPATTTPPRSRNNGRNSARADGRRPIGRCFDMGVSVAAVRMLKAVFVGRVDPATIYWGYDVTTKKADFAALLREVRGGKSLATALDALSPQVTHYARARRTLADYKKLAAARRTAARAGAAKGPLQGDPGSELGRRRESRGAPAHDWRSAGRGRRGRRCLLGSARRGGQALPGTPRA